MARATNRYRRQARLQARAEALPEIQGARRSQRANAAAVRSEANPLEAGLAAAEKTIRHSPLSAADKAEALKAFAAQEAAIPAGIEGQLLSGREEADATVADLRAQEAAQRSSILSGLLTQAAERRENVQQEIGAEQRGLKTSLQQAELEKALGLGDYATSPYEQAQIQKDEALTQKYGHEGANGGLTPYQNLEHHEQVTEDHDTARLHAKLAFEAAKEELGDPHGWEPSTWQKIAALVEEKGKVPTAAAEKAVGAIRDHFEPQGGDPFGIVGRFAHIAANALSQPTGGTPQTSTASSSTTPGAAALLKMLPALHGRY